MKLYELTIDDNQDEVFAISLVEEPAIESNFVYFGKQKKLQFAAIDSDQHLVMGPILVPDKQILRIDEQTNEPYNVFFKPETIKRLSEMYMEKKYNDKATLEHAKPIDGVCLVESWIVDDPNNDKSITHGLSVPKGTWMGTFKVNNPQIWNDYVKTGDVKGFSIEGMFSHKLVEASKAILDYMDKEIVELSEAEAAKVLKRLKHLIKSDMRYKKGKRMDVVDMDGAMPTVSSTYPGEASKKVISPSLIPEKPKLKTKWSDVFASIKK